MGRKLTTLALKIVGRIAAAAGGGDSASGNGAAGRCHKPRQSARGRPHHRLCVRTERNDEWYVLGVRGQDSGNVEKKRVPLCQYSHLAECTRENGRKIRQPPHSSQPTFHPRYHTHRCDKHTCITRNPSTLTLVRTQHTHRLCQTWLPFRVENRRPTLASRMCWAVVRRLHAL